VGWGGSGFRSVDGSGTFSAVFDSANVSTSSEPLITSLLADSGGAVKSTGVSVSVGSMSAVL